MADTARILEDFARNEPSFQAHASRAFDAAANAESIAFRAMVASVARRLGADSGRPPKELPSIAGETRPHWTLTDWIRAALIAKALSSVPSERRASIVEQLFEAGEIGEQESILRTLVLFENPELLLPTALLGCRTNARRVFEAIACDNPYPERHFPELEFNQMVIKSIFLEVPVSRIEGLARRSGPELARMARDYASERRAAGRPVPSDVDLVLRGSST
jgi:hypothetical protein